MFMFAPIGVPAPPIRQENTSPSMIPRPRLLLPGSHSLTEQSISAMGRIMAIVGISASTEDSRPHVSISQSSSFLEFPPDFMAAQRTIRLLRPEFLNAKQTTNIAIRKRSVGVQKLAMTLGKGARPRNMGTMDTMTDNMPMPITGKGPQGDSRCHKEQTRPPGRRQPFRRRKRIEKEKSENDTNQDQKLFHWLLHIVFL